MEPFVRHVNRLQHRQCCNERFSFAQGYPFGSLSDPIRESQNKESLIGICC